MFLQPQNLFSARHINPASPLFTGLSQHTTTFSFSKLHHSNNRIPTQRPVCFISIKTPDHDHFFQKGSIYSVMDS
jgi:hypothetical protein